MIFWWYVGKTWCQGFSSTLFSQSCIPAEGTRLLWQWMWRWKDTMIKIYLNEEEKISEGVPPARPRWAAPRSRSLRSGFTSRFVIRLYSTIDTTCIIKINHCWHQNQVQWIKDWWLHWFLANVFLKIWLMIEDKVVVTSFSGSLEIAVELDAYAQASLEQTEVFLRSCICKNALYPFGYCTCPDIFLFRAHSKQDSQPWDHPMDLPGTSEDCQITRLRRMYYCKLLWMDCVGWYPDSGWGSTTTWALWATWAHYDKLNELRGLRWVVLICIQLRKIVLSCVTCVELRE